MEPQVSRALSMGVIDDAIHINPRNCSLLKHCHNDNIPPGDVQIKEFNYR